MLFIHIYPSHPIFRGSVYARIKTYKYPLVKKSKEGRNETEKATGLGYTILLSFSCLQLPRGNLSRCFSPLVSEGQENLPCKQR